MADVQTEDGHLRIANDLWEAWNRAKLDRNEYKVLMAVVRLSYGWGRKDTGDAASYGRLQAECCLGSRAVAAGVSGLLQKQVVHRLREGIKATSTPAVYAPNKDYDSWSPAVLPSRTPTSAHGSTLLPPMEVPPTSTRGRHLKTEEQQQQRVREDQLSAALRELAAPITPAEHAISEWIEVTQQRLGCPRSRIGSDVHARWLGIARNPNRAEVEALVEWAIGIGDGAAFLRCFNDAGDIVSKRPVKVDRASKEERAIALRNDAHDLADVLRANEKDCTPENVGYWIQKHGKPWTVDELRPLTRRVLIDLGIAS